MKTTSKTNKNNNHNNLGFKIDSGQVLRTTWARYRKDIKCNPNSFQDFGTHLKRTWAIARENKINLSNFSFNEFYTKNYDKLLFFVNGILKNLDIAQEITNEAFVKFNNSLSIFDSSKSNITTYLHTIAKNLSLGHFKNLKLIKNQVEKNKLNISQFVDDKDREKHEFVDNYSLDVHEILENQETSNIIDNNLNSLDEKYKIISTLYFINHYKYREIAEILNININTVKTQIKRAKEQLQNNIINNNNNTITIKSNNNTTIFEPKKVIQINTNTKLETIQDNVLFYELENDNIYY